ncbi:MAG: hypothetical protein D4Q79_01415 [Spirochaetia bacterium]|nr:MAG: hypothetical protein D4Q79_01415 [Spirochaetia bacterium]
MVTPEEKIEKEYWHVLRKIKEAALRTKTNRPIEYWVNTNFIGGSGPTSGNEIKILEKLEELGALKVLNPGGIGEYEV